MAHVAACILTLLEFGVLYLTLPAPQTFTVDTAPQTVGEAKR